MYTLARRSATTYTCQEISVGQNPQEKNFQGKAKRLILATFQKSHLSGDLKIRCHGEKNFFECLSHPAFFLTSYIYTGQEKNKTNYTMQILHLY